MNNDYTTIIAAIKKSGALNGEFEKQARDAGEPLLVELEQLLETASPEFREGIYYSLSNIGSPSAREMALKHINDPVPKARVEAINTSAYLLTPTRYDKFLERIKVEPQPMFRGILARYLADSRFMPIDQRLRDLQAVRQWGVKGKFPHPTESGEDLASSLASEKEDMMLALAAVGDRQGTDDLINTILTKQGQQRGELLGWFGYWFKDEKDFRGQILRDLRRKEFVPMFVELLDKTDAVRRLEIDALSGRMPASIRACDAAVLMLRTLLGVPLPYEFSSVGGLIDKGRNVIFTQAEIATFKEGVRAALANAQP